MIQASSLAYAHALVGRLATLCRVRPCNVIAAGTLDGELGRYLPKTRTIVLCCDPGQLFDVVTHEFQHYLDDVVGATTGGEARGTHAAAFYERLEDLRARYELWAPQDVSPVC